MSKNSLIKIKFDSGDWIINLDYVVDVWYDTSSDTTSVQFLNEYEPRKISGREVFDMLLKEYSNRSKVLNEGVK